MKSKKTESNVAKVSAFAAELEDLQAAVELNLPPEGTLEVAGTQVEQAALLARLEQYGEAYAARATLEVRHEQAAADWPAIALEGRLFAREVRRALAHRLDEEARAGFDSTAGRRCEEKTARRILAAAKRLPTRDIRGVHVRRRSGKIPGGRFPWVE